MAKNEKKQQSDHNKDFSSAYPMTDMNEFFGGYGISEKDTGGDNGQQAEEEVVVHPEEASVHGPEGAGAGISQAGPVKAEAEKAPSRVRSVRKRKDTGSSSPSSSRVTVSEEVLECLYMFLKIYNNANPESRFGTREFADKALVGMMKKVSPDIYSKISLFLEQLKK